MAAGPHHCNPMDWLQKQTNGGLNFYLGFCQVQQFLVQTENRHWILYKICSSAVVHIPLTPCAHTYTSDIKTLKLFGCAMFTHCVNKWRKTGKCIYNRRIRGARLLKVKPETLWYSKWNEKRRTCRTQFPGLHIFWHFYLYGACETIW